MRHTPAALCGTALALLLAAATPSRAEFIHWSYNWSRSPDVIHADSPGTGTITLTDESLKSVVGDSFIVATNLRTSSTATRSNPDRFTAKPYTLNLFVLDETSGASGTITFTGTIDGTVSIDSANLRSTFTGQTKQVLVLGANVYTVTIGPFVQPGPPDASNAGSIGAEARVSVSSIVETLPEPGTLALACLGGLPLAWSLSRLRLRARKC
jgi:hypothetical protein